MIKKELVQQISDKTGIGLNEVTAVIDCFIDSFQRTMVKKEPLFLRGLFTAKPIISKYKKGRNIKKGTQISIPPHYKIKFVPSMVLVREMKKVVV